MGPREARKRFMKAVRMVLMNNSMSKWAAEVEEEDSLLSFSAFAEKMSRGSGVVEDLTFDKKYYKAKKELRLSQEVKNILTVEVQDRTQEQLKKSLYGLQSLDSFCEYPLHMQDKLCKVAFFHNVPPKRVIIRQGHNAEMFYIMISGQAIVTIMETDPVTKEPFSRTVNILRRGACFGELALIHHSKRTATVTSDTFCELLSIGREDFHDIFMRGSEPGKDPPHIAYLRTLPLVRNWPVDRLMEETEMCLFHYYKRGTVICKDSNCSEWIYIVKSGTCQVIKKLEDVKPIPNIHIKRSRRTKTTEDGDNYARNGANIRAKVDHGRRRRTKSTPASLDNLHLPDIFSPNASMRSVTRQSISSHDVGSESTRSDFRRSISRDKNGGTSILMTEYLRKEHTMMALRGGLRRPPDTKSITDYIRRENTMLSEGGRQRRPSDTEHFRRENTTFSEGGRLRRPSDTEYLRKENTSLSDVSRLSVSDLTDIHSLSTNMRTTRSKEFNARKEVFVQLEILHPGQVFGLTNLCYEQELIDFPQPSVSLVSKGAECLLLNKKFFYDNIAESRRHELKNLIHPYPMHETLQERLKDLVNWQLYKKHTLHTIVTEQLNIMT